MKVSHQPAVGRLEEPHRGGTPLAPLAALISTSQAQSSHPLTTSHSNTPTNLNNQPPTGVHHHAPQPSRRPRVATSNSRFSTTPTAHVDRRKRSLRPLTLNRDSPQPEPALQSYSGHHDPHPDKTDTAGLRITFEVTATYTAAAFWLSRRCPAHRLAPRLRSPPSIVRGGLQS